MFNRRGIAGFVCAFRGLCARSLAHRVHRVVAGLLGCCKTIGLPALCVALRRVVPRAIVVVTGVVVVFLEMLHAGHGIDLPGPATRLEEGRFLRSDRSQNGILRRVLRTQAADDLGHFLGARCHQAPL